MKIGATWIFGRIVRRVNSFRNNRQAINNNAENKQTPTTFLEVANRLAAMSKDEMEKLSLSDFFPSLEEFSGEEVAVIAESPRVVELKTLQQHEENMCSEIWQLICATHYRLLEDKLSNENCHVCTTPELHKQGKCVAMSRAEHFQKVVVDLTPAYMEHMFQKFGLQFKILIQKFDEEQEKESSQFWGEINKCHSMDKETILKTSDRVYAFTQKQEQDKYAKMAAEASEIDLAFMALFDSKTRVLAEECEKLAEKDKKDPII